MLPVNQPSLIERDDTRSPLAAGTKWGAGAMSREPPLLDGTSRWRRRRREVNAAAGSPAGGTATPNPSG